MQIIFNKSFLDTESFFDFNFIIVVINKIVITEIPNIAPVGLKDDI